MSTWDDGMTEFGVLFHGTSTEALPSIGRDGLDPARCSAEYVEEEGRPLVFLSLTRAGAEEFSRGAVLAVRLPEALMASLITDEGEYIRCPVRIPPEFITVLAESGEQAPREAAV